MPDRKPPVLIEENGKTFCPECGTEVFVHEQTDEVGGKIKDFSCTECDWEFYP